MSVKVRLLALVAVALTTLALMIVIVVIAKTRLGSLQDESFHRAQHEAQAHEASWLGAQFYQVFADAIINRRLDESRKDFSALHQEAMSDLDGLAKVADTPEEERAVAEARKSVVRVSELFEKSLLPALNEQNRVGQEIGKLDEVIDKEVRLIRAELAKVADSMAAEADLADRNFDETQAASLRNVVVIALLATLALGAYAFYIVRSILVPLNAVQAVTRRISEGDLSQPLEIRGKDEFALLLLSCQQMQQSLREVVASIQEGAETIATMSEEMASTTAQLSTSTEVQAQAAATMAASVDQISVSISQVSGQAGDITQSTASSGNEGRAIIARMVDNGHATTAAIEKAAGQIQQLGSLSEKISSIVNVIREVSEQTNLLALNAAIEAARAGEQGRGFAVVADEVRKLAERTGKSTHEIGAMIAQVQEVTHEAVNRMEVVSGQVHGAEQLSRDAGTAIESIDAQSRHVLAVIEEINTALREQSTASTDITRNVEQMAQISEENSAAVKQTATAASELESVATQLQIAVQRFRLD